MIGPSKRRFWRKCRVYFRRFRITVLFAVLALLSALIYLDLVGLPDFIKRPLVDGLRARGLVLDFSRLRLQWHEGFVAENVTFGRTNENAGPRLMAKKTSLQLNLLALARFRLQVDGLDLHEGRLVWPTNEANAPLRVLNIENIETGLRLGPGDEWSLNNFRAHFAGADFTVSAVITNASAIQDWKLLRTTQPTATNVWPERLHRLADLIGKISFTSSPDLRLSIKGDARDPQSINARFSLVAQDANTPWGRTTNVSLALRTIPGTNSQPSLDDESSARWTDLVPWGLDWKCELGSLSSEKISVNRVVWAGTWRAPELTITNVHAMLGGGTLNARAQLNVISREVRFGLVSDADPHAIESLLTPKTRLWLSKFTWLSPPHLTCSGAVILPAWTNRHPDWRGEARPTLRLAGEFAVTNGAYLGVQAHWARSHFTYTNMIWNLPDLEVRRSEGTLLLAHQEDDSTRDYHWHVRGAITPRALRPLLKTNQLRGFDLFIFNQPVAVDGNVWGRLYAHERIGFQLRVAATNFSVRGQSVGTFESDVYYTNRFLKFIAPSLTRGAQVMNASGVSVDFTAQRVYFTNGFSMAEPQAVAAAIGPKTARILEPYRFTQPPVAHVEGYAPLKGNMEADLRFALDGGPFEWSKFKVPRIEGTVHWRNRTLLLTNVQMDFYDGIGGGFAFFNFEQGRGSDFDFFLAVTNADFQLLMKDLGSRSTRMEGLLSGMFVVTNANSSDRQSWNGFGRVQLRDGYIWDIPVFGFLSPILNNVIPGLGATRATDGTAKFIVTNSVIFTDSLNVRSPMMRLQYDGTVNFDRQVDARVEAELLRDTWLVGKVISIALKPLTKLLEYKVTGTLSEPKPEPVYFVPKLLMMPLHPFRTLEELFPGDSGSTNALPTMKPE